jgi:TRAP-type uncharacterized transport system substrate-binding protein
MKGTILLAVAALALMGVSGAPAQQARQLSIATGGTGGIYYPLAGGFGTILAKELPGITATAEVTGGSLDNMKLVATPTWPSRRSIPGSTPSMAKTSSPKSCPSAPWPLCIPT